LQQQQGVYDKIKKIIALGVAFPVAHVPVPYFQQYHFGGIFLQPAFKGIDKAE
jgi:hypothetical protein